MISSAVRRAYFLSETKIIACLSLEELVLARNCERPLYICFYIYKILIFLEFYSKPLKIKSRR
jgi:hypothetical protein